MSSQRIESLRMDNGKLPAYAWPGGYPIFYIAADNGTICPECANGEDGSECQNPDCQDDKQWALVVYGVNYEDDCLYCDHCNRHIESAYGETDNE